MDVDLPSHRVLSIVLWITAMHSAAVGIGLLILPETALPFFGFDGDGGRFFRAQGGVFHLVMVIAYVWAARSGFGHDKLVEFAVAAKFAATLFLLSYYLMAEPIWSVLGSAVGDLVLGLSILLAYRRQLQDTRHINDQQVSAMGSDHA